MKIPTGLECLSHVGLPPSSVPAMRGGEGGGDGEGEGGEPVAMRVRDT